MNFYETGNPILKDDKEPETEAEKSLWQSFLDAPTEALDMIMDPNKKEREEEDKIRKEVKASKKAWRAIRRERFAFLDNGEDGDRATDEKKTEEH